jgi:hypothetical protein
MTRIVKGHPVIGIFGYVRIVRKIAVAVFALAIALTGRTADAQLSDLYPNYWALEGPANLSATLFSGGYVSEHFGTTEEGFQLEQSITPYIGLFGRATAYQLFVKHNQLNPFVPTKSHQAQYYYGRFQGGLDFSLYPGTNFYLSGGKDAGDSDSSLIEGDFSSWLMTHSRHPLNFSFSSIHTFQNGVTSSEIDFEWILKSTANWLLLGGAGGAIYGGGSSPTPGALVCKNLGKFNQHCVIGPPGSQSRPIEGEGGPDLGFFYRPWRVGMNAQFGYGAAKNYGQLNIYKQLGWTE